MTNQTQAYIYALVAVLLWSTVASAFKLTLVHIGKVELLLWASLMSVSILAATIAFTKRWHILKRYIVEHWLLAILLGTLNPFLYYLVLFYAYELLPAQEAQAINYTWALTLAYLSVPILGHKLSRWDAVAGLICYFGVLVIATHGDFMALNFTNNLGVVMALSSTVLWAIYWIILSKKAEDMVVVLFANFVVGLCLVVCYIYVSGIEISMNYLGVAGAAYVGMFEMGVTFVLWGRALALTDNTSRISNLIFLSPVLSLVFIYYMVGERIQSSTITALALIIFGLLIQKVMSKNS